MPASSPNKSENAETFARQATNYFERAWAGIGKEDSAEWWTMQNAKGDIADALINRDRIKRIQ